ncbi:MAG: hypothetical protein U0610_01620 [bacterium]
MVQHAHTLALDDQDLAHRREFAIRAMGVMALFLVVYSVGEVIVTASLAIGRDPLSDIRWVPLSLAMNAGMIGCLALARQVILRSAERGEVAAATFPWAAHATLVIGLPFVLGHMHLAGSQSNPNAILLLVYVIVAQRLLGSRAAWWYLALAEAGYLALVLLERAGVLTYAPLQADRNLGATFLHWPHVLINLATFTMVAVYLVAFMARSEENYLRARDEIRELEALLRMCAWCKRVCDEQGEWRPVEQFLAGRPRVTHGMCPSCSQEIMRETDSTHRS